MYKRQAIEFSVVKDGSAGLAALQATRFDAVILDLTLPDMSGFEWLERVATETPMHLSLIHI